MRAVAAWERFWFEPVSTSTLAVFRIVFGVITFFWTLSLAPDLFTFFSSDGILPRQPQAQFITNGPWDTWGLLDTFPGKPFIVALFVVLLVASVLLTVGFLTRLAAVAVFAAVLSFQQRNPFVFNFGDELVRVLAFYLMLAPAGAALSVDRWRKARGRLWDFPRRAAWPLRLVQIQLSLLYLTAVWAKARGTMWNNGTAVSYALRISDINRFPVPSAISMSELISDVLTFGTLAIELSIAVLVWNRKLRPWVLLLGVSLHLGIEYSIRVGFFGVAIFAFYLLVLSPAAMDARLLALRQRLERSKLRPLRRLALGGEQPEPASPG